MGTSCLLTARVSGWSRDPDPPARTMPFSVDMVSRHEGTTTRSEKKTELRAFVSSWQVQSSQPEPLPIVAPRLHVFAPLEVLEVPLRGLREAVLERVARRPPELTADLRRVDRVPSIVSGPIGHEGFQLAVAPAAERRVQTRRLQ